MGLPTLEKTWQYAANQGVLTLGAAATDYQQLLRAVKNVLSGSGSNFSNPWQVAASCDTLTFGKDYVDRWSSNASLVWSNTSNGARSWIVLTQPAIGVSCSLCIECTAYGAAGTIQRGLGLFFSPVSGFTVGGSITSRPSASDEIVLRDGTPNATGDWFGGISAIINSAAIHGWQSSDGKITRVVALSGTLPLLFWGVESVSSSLSGAAAATQYNPQLLAYGVGDQVITGVADFAHLSVASNLKFRTQAGAASAFLTSECTAVTSVNQPVAQAMSQSNEITANFPVTSVGFASTTPGARGRHGKLYDLYFGSPFVATGDNYPNDGTKTFAQFGSLVFPWNGSTPVVR